VACEPETVLESLNGAFVDSDSAAAAVGVQGTEASLLVLVPPPSETPERKPTLTKAGNPSLKKMTKSEAAHLYAQVVCGHMAATLREAFAAVPSLRSARIVAVRPTPPNAYGDVEPEVIAAARCDRDSLVGVRWATIDATQVVEDCCTEVILIRKGMTRALQPVSAKDQPELLAVLDVVTIQR